MRIFSIILLFAILLITNNSFAGTFRYACGASEVNCDGLFNDIVTDKYIAHYPAEKFEIFVYSKNVPYSDGSGVTQTIVGVVERNNSTYTHFPNSWWTRTDYFENMGNAYKKTERLQQSVRTAIQNMMAACQDSPNCKID